MALTTLPKSRRCDKDEAMGKLAFFGFWTFAALYAAIGLIGILLFNTQSDIASAADGYGVIRIAAQK